MQPLFLVSAAAGPAGAEIPLHSKEHGRSFKKGVNGVSPHVLKQNSGGKNYAYSTQYCSFKC